MTGLSRRLESIIWDFNGTIIDDLDLVVQSVNVQLDQRDLPLLTVEGYRDVFGFPVEAYYRRIGLDLDAESMARLSMEFFDLYVLGLADCPLHAGVRKALEQFHEAGLRQFVLSAMEEGLLTRTIYQLGIAGFFDAIYGLAHLEADSKVSRGQQLLADRGIQPDTALMIGDTDHDAEVAGALGVSVVLIARGHQSEARLRTSCSVVLESLQDLEETWFPEASGSGEALKVPGVNRASRREPNVKWGEVGIDAASSMEATTSAQLGHTGREVCCDEQYADIRRWAELPTREQQLADPKARAFRDRTLNAPRVSEQPLACFRGRFIRRCYPHGAERMGPPCAEQAGSGRYNKEHEPVLYLCDTEDGVMREFSIHKQRGRLFCQRFVIPSDSLKIADFRLADSASLEAQSFSVAEECGVKGRGPASLLFSQTIAEIVRDAGYDGMAVPGVRGTREQHYSNIVIFDPWLKGRWRTWLEADAKPYVRALIQQASARGG